MFEKLQELLKNSQSKYYHFPVACILECDDGSCFQGVNVETSSPNAGICAERNALFQALACGKKKENFKRIYLYSLSKKNILPCYICRQALIDYCDMDLEIITYGQDQTIEKYRLGDLCCHSFSEENLS